MQLILVDKRHEAEDAMSFIFHPAHPVKWQAGQFTELHIPHSRPDDRGEKRWFSISSSPIEEDVRITTRFAGEKSSTFKKKLFSLPIGTRLAAADPEGDFTFGDHTEATIFIAAGAGITPYRSILTDLDRRNLPINLTLLYANRDENFIYRDELEALARKHKGFRIKYFVSPQRIDMPAIQAAAPDLSKPLIYVSGPEPMVESFEKTLRDAGVPAHHIKTDFFPGYDWP